MQVKGSINDAKVLIGLVAAMIVGVKYVFEHEDR